MSKDYRLAHLVNNMRFHWDLRGSLILFSSFQYFSLVNKNHNLKHYVNVDLWCQNNCYLHQLCHCPACCCRHCDEIRQF